MISVGKTRKRAGRLFIFYIVLILYISPILAQETIVINEIMYNPAPELGEDDYYEYVELYNFGDQPVDLSGWLFTDGFVFTFPDAVILGQDEYLVVAQDPDTIISFYGINNVIGPFEEGKLNNGGESIELRDADSISIDWVDYNDDPPWPIEPDGNGPSLELINPQADNTISENWDASLVNNGTPGIINSVFIQEETITILSPNGDEKWEQGLSHDILWTSLNFTGVLNIELMLDTIIHQVLIESTENDGSWTWNIPDDQPVASNYNIRISDAENGEPFDVSDGFFSIVEPYITPDLVITEIMYNPPESGDDSLEFIEIFNREDYTVNLEGFFFAEGIEYIFPDLEIASGDYLLLAKDSLAILNTMGVHAFQWTAGGLNNGGEEIEIRDFTGSVVDYVDYDDMLPWDTLADGYGPSLTLCDPASDNSLAENWRASVNLVATNTAGDSIYATPGENCSDVGYHNITTCVPFRIFPNPGNGMFYISSVEIINYDLRIVNRLGKTIYSTRLSGQYNILDKRDLPSGFYIIQILDLKNNQTLSQKIIIFK